jgi:signal transduction histidine kinase
MTDSQTTVDDLHQREAREVALAASGYIGLISVVYLVANPIETAAPARLGVLGLAALLAARYIWWSRIWWEIVPATLWYNLVMLGLGLLIVFAIEWMTRGMTTAYYYLIALEGYLVFAADGHFKRARGWLIVIVLTALLNHTLTIGWPASAANLLQELPAFVMVVVVSELLVRQDTFRARLEKLLVELEQAHRTLRHYADKAEALAVAEERARLAREMHDTLGHTLTTPDVQIELLARLPIDQIDRRQVIIEQSRPLAKQGLVDLRRAVKALRPNVLETFSLSDAIKALVNDAQPTATFSIDYRINGDDLHLPPRLSLALYRAAQEALTNVQRHAQATRVSIELIIEASHLTLIVRNDDRLASTPRASDSGYGLRGLRERAEELGGQFQAGHLPDNGFELRMTLPR